MTKEIARDGAVHGTIARVARSAAAALLERPDPAPLSVEAVE
jgi:hypothetical protein